MARTRNFDPGRDRALHYASTRWQRHAKRLVYAYLIVASLPVGLGAVGQGRVASLPVGQGQGAENIAVGQRTEGAPCVACQALSITPAQIAVLPRALNGALVVVRVAPGTPPSAWSSALAEIRALGGRAGLHVTEIPAEEDPLLAADADTFVIETEGSDVDRVVFE